MMKPEGLRLFVFNCCRQFIRAVFTHSSGGSASLPGSRAAQPTG